MCEVVPKWNKSAVLLALSPVGKKPFSFTLAYGDRESSLAGWRLCLWGITSNLATPIKLNRFEQPGIV